MLPTVQLLLSIHFLLGNFVFSQCVILRLRPTVFVPAPNTKLPSYLCPVVTFMMHYNFDCYLDRVFFEPLQTISVSMFADVIKSACFWKPFWEIKLSFRNTYQSN